MTVMTTEQVRVRLCDLRRAIEEDAGGRPVIAVKADAASVLHDVGRWLGLSDEAIRVVLGESAAAVMGHPRWQPGVMEDRDALEVYS